jgi:hypothetical protein
MAAAFLLALPKSPEFSSVWALVFFWVSVFWSALESAADR